jgi:hypothetical protein
MKPQGWSADIVTHRVCVCDTLGGAACCEGVWFMVLPTQGLLGGTQSDNSELFCSCILGNCLMT